MPNQITRYTNGTFEGLIGTWTAEFTPASSAQIRDGAQFYEGAYSCRLTAASISNSSWFNGKANLLLIRFPAVQGVAYEATIRIKCDAAIPDDAIFLIEPNNPVFTNPDKGFVTCKRAADAKAGWVELKANFYASVIAGEAAVYVSVCFDTPEFETALSFSSEDYRTFYKNVFDFFAQTSIPAGGFVWLDLAYADAKAIPAEPDAGQFTGRKLYHVENVFMLSDGINLYEIEEPIKWDQVRIQVLFDESTYGYRFEFSDQDVLLEFDTAAGGEILRALYKAGGVQARASLKFGERVNNIVEILFEADINFGPESFRKNKYTVKANVERTSFNHKFRTRFDVRTNIFASARMDKVALLPISLRSLYLHPRILGHAADLIYNTNVSTVAAMIQSFPPLSTSRYEISIPPFKFKGQNIDDLQEPLPPDGLLIYSGLTLPPGVTHREFYFDARVDFRYTKTNSTQPVKAGLVIYKFSNISTTSLPDYPILLPLTSLWSQQDDGILAGTHHVSQSVQGKIDLVADEAIFIKAYVYIAINESFTAVTGFTWENIASHYLKITERTVVKPSAVIGPLAFEAVNRQLEIILDTPSPLKSNFLGRTDIGYAVTGCGANHFLIDGLNLRNFTGRPMNMSAKDWFNNLSALFCMGLSVERDNNNNEFIRFEPLEFFFKNVLLMRMDVISKYESRPSDDHTFSELDFGFNKFPQDNQLDSLQDFFTKFEYVTPLHKVKAKFSKIMDFLLSGYYIEYTRQESFRNKPTTAYETDANIFVIDARPEPSVTGVALTFDSPTKIITFDKIIPVVEGDFFTISGSGIGNGIYLAVTVEIPFTYDQTVVKVQALGVTGAGVGTVVVGTGSRYTSKRDEDFADIRNVAFPKSVYNMAHHIKRIALRWAKFYQAGWDFLIGGTSNLGIDFIAGRNNINVGTRLDPAVSCKYGEVSNVLYYDKGSERASGGYMQTPLFGKNKIELEAPLTWQTLNILRKAFENRHPQGKNFGYFQWTNPEGEIEKGWVLEMKFDPIKQMCKFTFIEKFNG